MKVYIFLANGFEEMEVTFPVSILRTAELDVVTVSISDTTYVVGSHGINIIVDSIFSEIDPYSADAIILPGGQPGTENLANFLPLKDVISYYEKNRIIAAICAAPSILGDMGLLAGKKAVCYPGYESKLKGATIKTDVVVIDGNLITAKGPGSAKAFSYALVQKLSTPDIYEKIRLIFD